MSQITLTSADGHPQAMDSSALSALAGAYGGEIITPLSPHYHEAREIWNAMIDRRPGLIARCSNAADISGAVRFAKSHGLLVSVRGGGHNIAGNALCDGGVCIDLSAMRAIEVDGQNRTVTVEPGCTLAEVDAATQAYGLAVPTGINSTTGIAGLTLGGGFGWISREFGLTIDSLLAAEVVTADGEMVTASNVENPDLFWGIRGGGGNFGIVSKFLFRAHPVGPVILSGLLAYPMAQAEECLRFYRELCKTLPDEVAVWVVLRNAPPAPFVPETWHGKPIIGFACCCAGEMAAGEKALAPLREFGRPILDVVGPHPYTAWQQALDPLLTAGFRNYWKTHDFAELSDGVIDAIVEFAAKLPSPHCEIAIAQLGGAISRVSADATAYGGREARFLMNVHGRWETPAEDEAGIAWCRDLFNATGPFSMDEAYINFMTEEEGGRVAKAYGKNYPRLIELKRRYDPENLFRVNQNIRP